MTTAYHAKYFAYRLTRQGGFSAERLSRSLFDACVDLNPHQIEAAAFAIRSPLSAGTLLADEVGLGKTIEAGIVLCQYWAESQRKLLVICPASLRKQWGLELEEKFSLPVLILDAKTYRLATAQGNPNPFEANAVVITSIHFASRQCAQLRPREWDLVVIDEAHKLRNSYRPSNKMGQNIRWALENRRKILVTATPLQNSLMEIYGLSTLIDERMFGNPGSFRSQYGNVASDLDALRNRLVPFCKRTLRRQVVEYVRFTERRLLTCPFQPSEQEHGLYKAVSSFLQRDDTYALPTQQRHLTVLIARKLLASSSIAIAKTLEAMKDRLIKLRDGQPPEQESLAEKIIEGEEIGDDLLDEFPETDQEDQEATPPSDDEPIRIDRKKLEAEIQELERYILWAQSIGIDTKTRALLKALDVGFKQLVKMGAARKAVVFTESRRTQEYLTRFLESNGYAGQVCTFNGSNTDPDSRSIYERWLEANRNTGRSSGSRQVDCRTAIIEHFRDQASIMIATEAAAEGINLQFCSMVINYDLPWNPQRIEQRIGRCHRYGQEFDVVVINFLNERNAADQRVYELLDEKLHLFRGLFGASDEVLGAIESGVDFERRILDIYQQCRTPEEIEAAFQELRQQLEETIESKLAATRRTLLEQFDEEVHARLRVNLEGTRQQLDQIGKLFWTLTKFVLSDLATFNDSDLTFNLSRSPVEGTQPGTYHLISKTERNVKSDFLYRLSHPLGQHVIETAKAYPAPLASLTFDISNHPVKISLVEALKGQSGWLHLQRLTIHSFELEEHLLFSALGDDGSALGQEVCEKLFNCHATVGPRRNISPSIRTRLEGEAERHAKSTISLSVENNSRYFNEERERLEQWAEDVVFAAEKDLKDTKNQIKLLNRQSRQSPTLNEQHKLQDKIRQLEKKKRRQRQQIFDTEDEIIDKRDKLISALEKRMAQRTSIESLFTIRWSVK
ncbi:MAG TPA: SNF2-related protein [bacterium]|nr:SNF2-related protein [bacterium]